MAQSKTQRHADADVKAKNAVVERHYKYKYHRQRA